MTKVNRNNGTETKSVKLKQTVKVNTFKKVR